jgi:hypothetical protein
MENGYGEELGASDSVAVGTADHNRKYYLQILPCLLAQKVAEKVKSRTAEEKKNEEEEERWSRRRR